LGYICNWFIDLDLESKMSFFEIPEPGTLLLAKKVIPTFYKSNENNEGSWGGWKRNTTIQKDMRENDLVMFLGEIAHKEDSSLLYGWEFLFERRNIAVWLGDLRYLPQEKYFWTFFKKVDFEETETK